MHRKKARGKGIGLLRKKKAYEDLEGKIEQRCSLQRDVAARMEAAGIGEERS